MERIKASQHAGEVLFHHFLMRSPKPSAIHQEVSNLKARGLEGETQRLGRWRLDKSQI